MLADMETYIETQIKSVTGVDADTVHKFPRHTNDWDEIFNLFKDDNDNINTWLIRWVRAPARWYAHPAYRIIRTWTWEVWFLYNIKDSVPSSDPFKDMVEGALNKLSLSPSLGDEADLAQPAQLMVLEEVEFSSILCHRAQLEISAEEMINPSSP